MAGAGRKTGGCLLDGWAGACLLVGSCVEGALVEAGGDADTGEEDVDGDAAAGLEAGLVAGLEAEGGSDREDCGGTRREAREAFTCRTCRLC